MLKEEDLDDRIELEKLVMLTQCSSSIGREKLSRLLSDEIGFSKGITFRAVDPVVESVPEGSFTSILIPP